MATDAVLNRVEFAWRSCPKWATAASSDVVDVFEGPDGLGTLLMIDVQGSGATGSRLAHTVMAFARELSAGGAEPSLVAYATSQHLFSLRSGKVTASIHVVRAQPGEDSVLITGYGKCSLAYGMPGTWETSDFAAHSAGTSLLDEPANFFLSVPAGTRAVIANDGIARDQSDLRALLPGEGESDSTFAVARCVAETAFHRDNGRPKSDMAVAVVARLTGSEPDRFNQGTRTFPVRIHRGAM